MVSRRMQNLCSLGGTAAEIWQRLYGTEAVGQLPQWKKDQHEGSCWIPCPYDTVDRCSDLRKTHLLGATPVGTAHVDGDGKEYYMKPQSRTSWGYECTSDDCLYYTTINPGVRYFYS